MERGELWETIEAGSDVRDAADDLVGVVLDAAPTYVLVEQGRFFPDDVFIPIDAVAGVEAGVVRLNISGEEALAAGWHAAPPVGVGALSTEGLAPGIAIGGRIEELGTTEEDAETEGGRPVR